MIAIHFGPWMKLPNKLPSHAILQFDSQLNISHICHVLYYLSTKSFAFLAYVCINHTFSSLQYIGILHAKIVLYLKYFEREYLSFREIRCSPKYSLQNNEHSKAHYFFYISVVKTLHLILCFLHLISVKPFVMTIISVLWESHHNIILAS